MLDLYIEVRLEIASIEDAVIKLLGKSPKREHFKIGTSNVFSRSASDSQLLYLASVLESRWRGAKFLGDPDLIKETVKDRSDLKKAFKFKNQLNSLNRKLFESEELFREISSLLTFEEKRELFKLDNPK